MRPLGVGLLALALLAPALAGCLGATDSVVKLVPYVAVVRAEPGRTTELATFVNNTGAFREDLEVAVEGLPANWTFTAWPGGDLSVAGRSSTFAIYAFTPAEDARHGAYRLRLVAGGARADVVVEVRDLGAETARRGVGAQVRTVGFLDDGSVFYTNMKEVRDNSGIAYPDRSPGNDSGMDPLSVYVGGKRRTPPPEPYNSTGYFPVIEGFDARLREGNAGMRAGETLVVRVPAEKAYTLPGNEEHALYGVGLNFLIEVVSVDVLPAARGDVCVPQSDVCLPPPASR